MSTRDKSGGWTSNPGNWIPLMDYAMKKGVSLSTLRRHIKTGKILNKLDNGRYLLFDDLAASVEPKVHFDDETPDPVKKLQTDLEKANEEIAELKTLIALYEERPHQRST
jgi:hypothetical protein